MAAFQVLISLSVFRRRVNLEDSRHPYQVGERAGAHLEHHACAVRLHGPLGGSQFRGDLLVEQPFGYQAEHFAFAGSQRMTVLVELDPLALFGAPFAGKIGASSYRVK